jgi:hypothetical protein
MDKHTKRYLSEFFGHHSERLSFYDALSYINQADSEDDFAYLSSAIQDHITGDQRQFLQFKLWGKAYD